MSEEKNLIDRREAVRRVGLLLGGMTLVGGTSLLEAATRGRDPRAVEQAMAQGVGPFTARDVALLDEVADTILPPTKTPGAKAAKTGAFMALMVTDTYEPKDQQLFREGMQKLDARSRQVNGKGFMQSTPRQRLALLQELDREQKEYMDAREMAARRGALADADKPAEAKEADKRLPDQRKEKATGSDVGAATAITADAPAHYFRMMKELAMLGYFTSQIGMTQAQRYVESPGRFDPCVPYRKGEKAWAPHA